MLFNCGVGVQGVSWTARRSNQSVLKDISPGCSLEGLMLKLKLQSSGHLMWRANSFEKNLMLGKIEGGRRRGRQRMRWLDGITDSMDMSLVNCGSWWWTGRPGMLRFMGSQRVGHDWVTELNWTYTHTHTRFLLLCFTVFCMIVHENYTESWFEARMTISDTLTLYLPSYV